MEERGVRRFAELLRGGRWFAGLAGDLQQALLDAAELKKLAKDEWLFARGENPGHTPGFCLRPARYKSVGAYD